jgi:2-polyprenyl-6-methoxyphenol hydroxylase-like FAD-dependent oxidoreductase
MAPFVLQFNSLSDLSYAQSATPLPPLASPNTRCRYGHKQLKSRVVGRLAVAGDAAHSMSPQLGQVSHAV